MTLNIFQDERATNYKVNQNFFEALSIAGKELIRASIGSQQVMSAGFDDWACEAYVDADGRYGTVITGSTTATLSGTCYLVNAGSKVIFHSVPAGRFSGAPSRIYGTAIASSWEVGADINFRVRSGTNISAWIGAGSIGSIASIGGTPMFYEVMLTQKASSPTGSVPGIYGFALRCV